jgi:hypothetical protein
MNHLPPEPECPVGGSSKIFENSLTYSQLKFTTCRGSEQLDNSLAEGPAATQAADVRFPDETCLGILY